MNSKTTVKINNFNYASNFQYRNNLFAFGKYLTWNGKSGENWISYNLPKNVSNYDPVQFIGSYFFYSVWNKLIDYRYRY